MSMNIKMDEWIEEHSYDKNEKTGKELILLHPTTGGILQAFC
jgi:hypothetical protein